MRASGHSAGAVDGWRFHLTGGRLCLDLANTVSWRVGGRPIERLTRYLDLVSWARQAGVLTDPEVRRLAAEARRRRHAAARVLKRAQALREAIYRVFSNISQRRAPAAPDLATLNAELADALGRLRLTGTSGAFALEWPGDAAALERVLWPVARSAADLLTSNDLELLKRCPAVDCGWIFLDLTRNRSRRWCKMQVCGNRAKARRSYARRKGR